MTTFSDLMTLLLTFFVLLYSFSTVDAQKFREAAASLQAVLTGTPYISIMQDDMTMTDPDPGMGFNETIDEFSVPVVPDEEEEDGADGEDDGADELDWKLEQRIMSMYEDIFEFVNRYGLEDEVQVSVTTRGVLLNIRDTVLFDSGRSYVKQEGEAVLDRLGELLNRFDHEVEVVGHTDNRPINSGRFPSNWELSVDRATQVVHYLIDRVGMSPRRLKAAGYGEFRPVAANDTAANMAKNRRVNMLVVLDEEVGGFIGN